MSHPPTPLERKRGSLPKLKSADIVLVHIKNSPLRALIRAVTKSYWDHVAMVVYPENEYKLRSNIIMENFPPPHTWFYFFLHIAEKGTVVHKLEKYLNNPAKYDVGVKRVAWFDEEHRRRVATFMLTNLDTPYWRLSLWKFFWAAVWPQYRRWFLRHQRWSCSALVQRAYYESIGGWRDRFKVIFKSGDLSPIEMQDLVSPAEIANFPGARWIFNEH